MSMERSRSRHSSSVVLVELPATMRSMGVAGSVSMRAERKIWSERNVSSVAVGPGSMLAERSRSVDRSDSGSARAFSDT